MSIKQTGIELLNILKMKGRDPNDINERVDQVYRNFGSNNIERWRNRSNKNNTFLHELVEAKMTETIQHIVAERQFPINTERNQDTLTAYGLAIQNNYKEVCKVMKHLGAEEIETVDVTQWFADEDEAKSLKPVGANLFHIKDPCTYQSLAREFVASLNWKDAFFDKNYDRCYCPNCYKKQCHDVINAGGDKYVIPRGWVRLGIRTDIAFVEAHDVFDKWIVTFHGTSKIAAQSIIAHRQFCMPGDKLIDGTELRIRPGHIPNMNFVYTSPTIAYSCGPAYSPIYDFYSKANNSKCEVQIVLQCRQMPDSFKIGPETIGAKGEICPHIPNSKIEYFTDRRGTIVAYGLLVRFRPKH